MLLNLLRHFGLKGTELERAQAGTIRLKLLDEVRCSLAPATTPAPSPSPV